MSSNIETPGQRLGRYVLQRREDRHWTQADVTSMGGASNTWQTKMENGLLDQLTNATAKKIDQGLGWVPGSAWKVWEGGEPTPIEELDVDAMLLEQLEKSNLTEAAKVVIRELLKGSAEKFKRERGAS